MCASPPRAAARPSGPLKLAYTDSVLFSLPIRTRSPQGAYVVDLTPVFMSDLPQIGIVLPGFSFSRDKVDLGGRESQGLPKNVELQVAATYASSGHGNIDSVPDSRGVTINVHYSISELPITSYQPRLADDRVGYFLDGAEGLFEEGDRRRPLRALHQPLEPGEGRSRRPTMSTPKKPIVFWLEKTIPFKYRKPIRDGILEWNKAFEKAGFYDAIEVRQQPDDATWEPDDIRYNTFRWITAGVGFAMGPSRVNPTTGQILDADIIFDADFLQFWKQEYETFTPASVAMLTGGPIDLAEYRAEMQPHAGAHATFARCPLRVQPAGRHVATAGARGGRDGFAKARATRRWKSSSCRASRNARCTRSGTRWACGTTSRPARCTRSRS